MERAELALVEAYEAANGRPITELELQLLREIVVRFDAPARHHPGMDGIRLVCAAIDALVAQGDLPVAPRKVRLWCERWAAARPRLEVIPTAPRAGAVAPVAAVAAGASTRRGSAVAWTAARRVAPAGAGDVGVQARGGAPVALATALDGMYARYLARAARRDADDAGQRPEGRTTLVQQQGRPVPIREVREIPPVPEIKPVEPIAPPVEGGGAIEAVEGRSETGEPFPADDLQALWTAVLARLERRVSPANFAVWLRSTRALSWQGDVLRVGVPNRFAQQWIETRFRRDVQAVLASLLDRPARVVFVVVPFDEPAASVPE